MKKTFLTGKYESVTIGYLVQNFVPKKILLKFPSEELQNDFFSQYNNIQYDKTLNYSLCLEKQNDPEKIESLKKEIKEAEKPLEEYKMPMSYEDEWRVNYSNSPEKPGLLYINEEEVQKGYEAVKFLVKKFGKNLLNGKRVLNISLPVFIFDKRTLHQCYGYDLLTAPVYFLRAFYTNDKIERLKWITTYLISMLHLAVIQIKPFNPIIGETFQCRIGNMNYYVEHTVNHPVTANFYGIEDDGNYIIYGYLITDASIAPNAVNALRLGKFFLKFKDGTIYQIRIPDIVLKGIAVGDRTFNYILKGLVLDLTNNLCSVMDFNPEEPGFFSSFFKTKKTFPDYFFGKIIESKYITIDEKSGKHIISKEAKAICQFEGEWTSFLNFEGQEYWNIEDLRGLPMMEPPNYKLPSDGSKRPDLIKLIENDIEQSQIEKEKLEVRQRQDRKLRADYLKSLEDKKQNKAK